RGGPGEHLAVMTVDREGDRQHFATPARDQKDVGAPTLVRHRLFDSTEMRSAMAPVQARGQHQAVQLHHAPNALAVVAGAEGPVHHRPHAAIAVSRAAVRHRVDLLQDQRIGRPVIAPARPGPAHVVGRSPRDPQDLADDREGQARHRADSLRNDGVFFTISWAARRISTSIVLRPSARSSSRILAYASRNWLAGTTSSLAWTAVVAPASANRLPLRITPDQISSSPLSP